MNYTKKLNIDINISRLREQYLEHFTVPPKLKNTKHEIIDYSNNPDEDKIVISDKTVQKVGDYGYGIVVKHIPWEYELIRSKLDITIDTARVFITNPYTKLPIHKDAVAGGKNKKLREWAINIPLFGCERGETVWYNDIPEYENCQMYSAAGALVSLSHPNPIEHYREGLDCIKLIKTDVFHGVDNSDNPNYRVILSLRSNDNLSWTEISERIDESF